MTGGLLWNALMISVLTGYDSVSVGIASSSLKHERWLDEGVQNEVVAFSVWILNYK